MLSLLLANKFFHSLMTIFLRKYNQIGDLYDDQSKQPPIYETFIAINVKIWTAFYLLTTENQVTL